MKKLNIKYICLLLQIAAVTVATAQTPWQSQHVTVGKDGKLTYHPDEKGNIIPDFSRVGYHQGLKVIPKVKNVIILNSNGINDQEMIQQAIDQLAQQSADANGIRGAILLKKGNYKIPGTLNIKAGGIVLRGEGEGTKLIATGEGQRKTIIAGGTGSLKEINGTRMQIVDSYVPVGAKQFNVVDGSRFEVGDQIVVFRPGTTKWIADLKMDQIEPGNGTVQWKPAEYNLEFERKITAVKGNTISIDNPIVMAMEKGYGGGEIFKYTFEGRIAEVGIENLTFESEFKNDTDENHGWDAISFGKIENSWVTGVTSRYYGYSCVNLSGSSKQITVDQCKYLSPKSQITGGRRYSFNNDGQLNLIKNCFASEGRHDYVTGAKVRGPNVFYNCKSVNAKADVGPHHRWAVGTLYDNVVTDGEINIQDRGNWGTGHGWAGVTQVLWNCSAAKAAVQNPYVSGKNYAIGLDAKKVEGRLKGRPDGVWEGQQQKGLDPQSLYLKQLKALQNKSL